MRAVWLVVALLALPAMSGCLTAFKHKEKHGAIEPADVGYDPTAVRVTGVERSNVTITSFDGTQLAAIIYDPVTGDSAPGGAVARWGTVVFIHGWGEFKEMYEGAPGAAAGMGPPA